jgi:glycosyltransferase involved in cell wall biosynthesis
LVCQCRDKPVEIVGLLDNQRRFIGDKRNDLMDAANGQFFVFVDDDDEIATDFVDAILAAISEFQRADCIAFDKELWLDGRLSRIMHCYVGAGENKLTHREWEMSPNHIAVWRTDRVRDVRFKSMNMGEDNDWYDRAVSRIREHAAIGRVLYKYHFDRTETETQHPNAPPYAGREILLSILIPTVPTRLNTFWPQLMDLLTRQVHGRSVEILGLLDNFTRTVGEKRNVLLQSARGKYLAFVDDDDQVAGNYVEALLSCIRQADDADVIVFDQLLRPLRGNHKLCRYGVEFTDYSDGRSLWTGPPAHTQCWRTALAKQFAFPGLNYTEDSAWVKQAVTAVQKQFRYEGNPLYFYDFNPATSETRKASRRNVV